MRKVVIGSTDIRYRDSVEVKGIWNEEGHEGAIQETAETVETKMVIKRPKVQSQHRVNQVQDWAEQPALCLCAVTQPRYCVEARYIEEVEDW